MAAIKMGDQALKKVMKADNSLLRSWICSQQALSYCILKENATQLQKAEHAVVEDPHLAWAWSMLGRAHLSEARFDESIANNEKAIAMGLHPDQEEGARDDIKQAQEALAEQAAQPAGGGGRRGRDGRPGRLRERREAAGRRAG